MIPFYNALSISGGGEAAKTYPEFQAHVTALADLGFTPWAYSDGFIAGGYITTAAAAQGSMIGTPWNSYMSTAITTCRVVQHGLSSEAVFNTQIAEARTIFFRIAIPGNAASYTGINRNGYLSQSFSSGTSYPYATCTEILAWIDGAPMRMQPGLGLGPTPYNW